MTLKQNKKSSEALLILMSERYLLKGNCKTVDNKQNVAVRY